MYHACRNQEAETSIPSVHGVLVLSWGKRHSRHQIAVSHFLAKRESLICCHSTIWVSSVHPTSFHQSMACLCFRGVKGTQGSKLRLSSAAILPFGFHQFIRPVQSTIAAVAPLCCIVKLESTEVSSFAFGKIPLLRPMPGKSEMKERRARRNGVEGEEKALNDDYEKKEEEEEEEKFECSLVKYEALPDYLKDNEFILDYYRSEWPLKETFLSVFLWHNETLNIWTHLGGFFLFLGLTIMNLMEINGVGQHISTSSGAIAESLMKNVSQSLIFEHQGSHIPEDQAFTLTSKPVTFTRVPRWPWFVFLGGAMVCLSFSSITHLLHSHSRRANFFFWALDYTGISTMIISSFFPAIYYAFFCHPTLQLLYLSTISLIGLITVITLTSPSLSSPRFRPLRGGLFLGMGFWGLIPTVHAIIINWGHSDSLMGHAYEAAMALAYATGAGIYMSRIPERWRPGAFDIAGHSHQIFHVFVIFGALAHYTAMRVLMDWRDGGATCLLQ